MSKPKSKATPGPWSVFQTADHVMIDGADLQVVPSVQGKDSANQLANAALIAASPMMKAALERAKLFLVHHADRLPPQEAMTMRELIGEAIAAAEGRK